MLLDNISKIMSLLSEGLIQLLPKKSFTGHTSASFSFPLGEGRDGVLRGNKEESILTSYYYNN